MALQAPNRNRLWADLLVEELVRNGVEWFCMAPGSRSTPLVTAVAAHPRVRRVMHVDERGAAFHALGIARATGRPAVWLTTSGTAVANGLPAVAEASNDGVPLLMLTADRPPELRDTGANQTIDQVSIFGSFVRWQVDLPAPDPAIDDAFVLTTVDQAVHRTMADGGGPVHLNCMFREPLAPDPGPEGVVQSGPSIARWSSAETPAPFTRHAPRRVECDTEDLERALDGCRNVLVVAGRMDRDSGRAVRRLAIRRGWPVFADITSQMRLGPASADDPVIRYGDLILARPTGLPVPDAVLRFGRPGVSKRTATWIEALRPAVHAVIADTPDRLDPGHSATHRLSGISAVCEALAERGSTSNWAREWRDADRWVADLLDARFADGAVTEPGLAHLLSRILDPAHGLMMASSMPIRDMDMFAAVGIRPLMVAANRGASGIDGTIATAAGLSDGLGSGVTLVIGDLAFQHDLNALALLRSRHLVVVLVNNDGGGIFSFLPIARHSDVFDPWFSTPHGLTFDHAAALYGLEYDAPADLSSFAAAYRAACARPGSTIIEVRTDRGENRALHADLVDAVGRRVSAS